MISEEFKRNCKACINHSLHQGSTPLTQSVGKACQKQIWPREALEITKHCLTQDLKASRLYKHLSCLKCKVIKRPRLMWECSSIKKERPHRRSCPLLSCESSTIMQMNFWQEIDLYPRPFAQPLLTLQPSTSVATKVKAQVIHMPLLETQVTWLGLKRLNSTVNACQLWFPVSTKDSNFMSVLKISAVQIHNPS